MTWFNLNWNYKRFQVVFCAVILTISLCSICEVNAIDAERTNDLNSQLSGSPRLTRGASDYDHDFDSYDYSSYEDPEVSDKRKHKDDEIWRHGNGYNNRHRDFRRNSKLFNNRHGRRYDIRTRKFDLRNILRRSRVKLPNGELSSVIDPYVIDWGCKKKAKLITFRKGGFTSRREFELFANEMERTKMEISNCTYRGGCYKTYKIVKIQKIINGCLWKRYLDQKKTMEAEMAIGNERLLFHGTNNVWGIVNNGFHKPTSAGSYGTGIYFTDRSSAANEFVFGRPIGAHGCSEHDDISCDICESNVTTRVSRFILNNSRSKARAIVGALTGHYATGAMMHKMKLTLDPSCRACGEDEETMEHVLCDCDVLAVKRMCLLGDGYPKPGDLRFLPLNGVASFIDHVFEGVLLLCRVNLGKKFNQHGGGNYTKPPVGFHSVAGKFIPTMFTEYVVYKPEQIYPEYLITYKIEH